MTIQSSPAASEADLARIAQFNRTEATFPDDVSLQRLIEAQVDARPLGTAVVCDHDSVLGVQSLTYAQLNEKVNQLAHRLRAEGVGPGDVVGLMVERSFAMIIGILGIIKAGAAYLPVPTADPPDRVTYMLAHGGVRVVLVHDRTAQRIEFGGLIINLDDRSAYGRSTANPSNVNKPQDPVYVIYTSGSTGKPKGVLIEHRSLINRLHWMQRAYPIGHGDVILQKTPYCFDVSVWELFWWALQGATLCFLPPGGERHPLVIVESIRTHHVSVMHFVPSMLNVFLEYLESRPDSALGNLASVRQVFASGETLTPSHVRKFNDVWGNKTGARLTNLYGPTEATIDVSYFDCPTHNEFESIPIGRPIQNTRFYVIKGGVQTAIGEDGELCIAGIGLARCYMNDAAMTAEQFIDNPVNPGERIYRTGDIARWLPDGNIEYLGRADQQVKIRGLRIELGEIENTITEYPGIVQCVTKVKKYSESVSVIVAYLVCKSHIEIDNLKHYLKKQLPDYMIPSHFQQIANIPLTPSGKVDRKALPEPMVHVKPHLGS